MQRGGDWAASIITIDGKEEEYKIRESDVELIGSILDEGFSINTNYEGISYGVGEKLEKYPNQIISYRISSDGKLLLRGHDSGEAASDSYNKTNNSIGAVKLSDTANVLDISDTDISGVKAVPLKLFVDGQAYTVKGYNEVSGEYSFAIITSGPKHDIGVLDRAENGVAEIYATDRFLELKNGS